MPGSALPSSQAMQLSGPPISRKKKVIAYALVTSLFFLWGFTYGLLDVLNKHFQTVFGVTKLQTTGLQVAYFGAYLVWSLPASQVMSRYGYKSGIYMGLCLYSLGAIFFWPCAKYESFAGFVVCTLVIGCGLASLEVAANSYVTVIGDPKHAALRINFSQSFNGVATFTGPLIASKYFFEGENAHSLTNVQYVYLAVACLGALVAFLFWLADIPEVSEAQLQNELEEVGAVEQKPLWKYHHTTFGFVSQFCYVGAQVTLAAFALYYVTEQPGVSVSSSAGSRLFSYMQITFMVGRFATTPLFKWLNPRVILTIYGTGCALFCALAANINGIGGIVCLYITFWFESVIYPTIFAIGTENLGKWTKRGSSLIVMGVSGGAAFPPPQGALADATTTQMSYWIPFIGYVIVMLYGIGTLTTKVAVERKAKDEGLTSEVVEASKEKEHQHSQDNNFTA